MRNRNIITNAGLIALALVSSALAAPIPLSLTGIPTSVNVVSRAYPIDNGGSFNAFVANPTLNPGFATIFWCVDIENGIDVHDPLTREYDANIVLVSATTAQAQYVRKGNETVWADGQGYTAQQRYNAAAFLVEMILAGGPGPTDLDAQRAIWRFTDAGGANTPAFYQNGAYALGQAFLAGANPSTQRTWATVSGAVLANGQLVPSNTRQTFLVEVAPVPEPGTYALMGGGLLLLAGLRRRRRTN